MPTRPSKNVVGKYLEFPPGLAGAVERFAKARGQSFKAVVVEALRRHMANPPPLPELPPLPPVPPPARGKRRK
jgi:hypothetical protein